MVIALLLVAQTATTPAPVSTQVAFLKKLKPAMTQSQIRSFLPKETVYAAASFVPPVDGRLTGTVVAFKGPITGTMSFLRADQIQALRDYSGDLAQDYLTTDPVHGVQLTIRFAKTYSKSKGYGLLQELKKALGTPVQNPYWSSEWANDFGGWMAAWKLNSKPLGFYEYQGDTYESRLELTLGTPIYQD